MFIPDPDLDFLPTPDPGSRDQKGTGSRIQIRNTGQHTASLYSSYISQNPALDENNHNVKALQADYVPDSSIFFLSCKIRNVGISPDEKYRTRLVKNWYLDAGAQTPLW
jgi:hypothetical protein